MNQNEAIKILSIKKHDITNNDIEAAYRKTMRRYPPESFPEKSGEIREAYDLLSNNDSFWNDFINKKEIDFSFLSSYPIKQQSNYDQIAEKLLQPIKQGDFFNQVSPIFDTISDDEMFDIFSELFGNHIS